jgi:hypothetical protein
MSVRISGVVSMMESMQTVFEMLEKQRQQKAAESPGRRSVGGTGSPSRGPARSNR